ncbi:MAG: CHASE2 domain-containing protein [Fibrobacter sp.]|nr:CHASE2 domain-containing protein [Fibrobacter sp.]
MSKKAKIIFASTSRKVSRNAKKAKEKKISKKAKKVIVGFIASAVVVFLILVFGATQHSLSANSRNGAENLENLFYDLFFKASTSLSDNSNANEKVKTAEKYDPTIVIVDIDEPSLFKLGNYNEWDRSIHANVVNHLNEGGAAAIGFDILFKNADFGKQKADQVKALLDGVEPDKSWDSLYPQILSAYNYDSMLVDAVKRSGNVIICDMFDESKSYKHESQWRPLSGEARAQEVGLQSVISSYKHIDSDSIKNQKPTRQVDSLDNIEPKDLLDNVFPELAQAGKFVGSVNAYPDNDGVVRHVSMLYRFPNPFLEATRDPDLENIGRIDSSRIYSTMSLMTVLHLFHQKPENVEIKMGQYINVGKPFGVYRDSSGEYHTTYPHFSYPMFLALQERLKEKKFHKKAINDFIDISSKIIATKSKDGSITFEIFEGQVLTARLSNLVRNLDVSVLETLEKNETRDLGDGLSIRHDNEENNGNRFIIEDSEEEEEAIITPYVVKAVRFFKDTLQKLPEDKPTLLSLDLDIRFDKATKKWHATQVILSDAVIRDIQATDEEKILNLQPGEEIRFGKEKHIPIDRFGRYQVRYKGRYNTSVPLRTFQHLSYYDVTKNRVDPIFYQGKIFILGSAAAALFDFATAPHEENYPAVLIHATIIKNILEDDYIVTLGENYQQIIVILLALLCVFIGLFLKSYYSVPISLVLMVIYTFAAYCYFESGLYIGVSKQLLAIILTNITALVVQFYFENREKSFINNAFKQYISPELIDAMVVNEIMPTLGGSKSDITAYFTDIASFSTFSEEIGDPQKLVELLNDYLTEMTDTLLENKGTLDKYEGDAIIAFFGAPMPLENHALSACYSAVDMQRKLMKLRKKWAQEKNADGENKWPKVVHNMHMRIGINSGDIVTGNMGSSTRKNYTMMGDAVNLASRLESAAKQYGAYIQISEETKNRLKKDKGRFIYRTLDTIRVVGKSEPIKTFELLEKSTCENADQLQELVVTWERARKCYLAMKWDEAIDLFTQCLDLEPHHPDRDPGSKTTPSHVYIKRCEAYKKTPPVAEGESWDGVFTATEK